MHNKLRVRFTASDKKIITMKLQLGPRTSRLRYCAQIGPINPYCPFPHFYFYLSVATKRSRRNF